MAVGKVWVYAETDAEKVNTATLELLTKAREIGATVEAIYAGKNPIDAVAASVGEYGATKLHVDRRRRRFARSGRGGGDRRARGVGAAGRDPRRAVVRRPRCAGAACRCGSTSPC